MSVGARYPSRVTIQRPPGTDTDDAGVPLTNWVPLYSSVPARIEPLSGRELVTAQQLADAASVRICIRYLPNVTGRNRIVDDEDGTVYDILFPQDIEKAHRELEILCSAGLTQG